MPRAGVGFAGRYALLMLGANLVWEIVQLPLYTLWSEATVRTIVLSIAHCTLGDLAIATGSLLAGAAVVRFVAGRSGRPPSLALVVTALGVAYTIFSEWLNVAVLRNWQYGALMPVLPPLGTGLSPLLQWLALPPACLALASRWADRTRH